jgi:hypothetical protein
MYLPAFGSSAAIHLAEKYNCEWLQDVTTPPSTTRKSSSMFDNDDSRIIRRHQSIGDDDEFVVTFQTLQPSYSSPNLTSLIAREPLRERSYSLTTLDAYARLDITRDTLEQMWLSLLDLAFSDKEDIELGETKLHHIRGLSKSYSNMNETIIEKSRSHGDIFSTANRSEQFSTKKSKSFDTTTLSRQTTTNNDPANVGLLQGAAISEPFVDRIYLASNHSDTEPNLLDFDNDSIQSLDKDDSILQQEYDEDNAPTPPLPPPSPPVEIDENTSPVIKEPLTYIFRNPHQLYSRDDDEYDLEVNHDTGNYLPETTLTTTDSFGAEDMELYTALSSDYDEVPAVREQYDPREELTRYRPHSLSTIPSSRASQYRDIIDDSDEVIDYPGDVRRSTISVSHDEFSQSEHSEEKPEDAGLNTPSSSAQSISRSYSPEPNQVRTMINHSTFNVSISSK